MGDVAVNGITASERTSGSFDYFGTIYTNDKSIAGWKDIIENNTSSASVLINEGARIANLTSDFDKAVGAITEMPVTPGFEAMTPATLNGLNTKDGQAKTYVINMVELKASSPIDITGDRDDMFYVRWDEEPQTQGLQGQVKFQGGGGINPLGNLVPTNFINLAGDINSSGGGSNPSGLASYLAGMPNKVSGGGFFTGYWLTVGNASGESAPLSNGIFVGGWYSNVRKFSMTSGTSGIYVPPPQVGEYSGFLEASGTYLVD
ncbi:hypothetical protein ATO6_14155 [Oceanicola sp. 22II-s10i]|nr:hypothetical protein ATO6_14155 [Oceanicola sp. 22II-s10i]